jgi:hypothetical protein
MEKPANPSSDAVKAPKRCPGCLLCLRAGLWRARWATTRSTPLTGRVDSALKLRRA